MPCVDGVRRLRDRFESLLLFGETEEEACKRLRHIEMNESGTTIVKFV